MLVGCIRGPKNLDWAARGSMSITLHVSLLSGRRVSIQTGLNADIVQFRQHAQSALSVVNCRLVHSCGWLVNEVGTIGGCGLQTDDDLTLQVQPLRIMATLARSAFAGILADGSVVAWGDAHAGGDSSAVSLGAMRTLVAIAVLCKVSCRMYGSSMLLSALLQLCWLIGLW